MKQLFLTFQSYKVEENLNKYGESIVPESVVLDNYYSTELYNKIGRLGHFAVPITSLKDVGVAFHISMVDNFDVLYLVEVDTADVIELDYVSWINYLHNIKGILNKSNSLESYLTSKGSYVVNSKPVISDSIFDTTNSIYKEYNIPTFTKDDIVKKVFISDPSGPYSIVYGEPLQDLLRGYVDDIDVYINDMSDCTDEDLDLYEDLVISAGLGRRTISNSEMKTLIEIVQRIFVR